MCLFGDTYLMIKAALSPRGVELTLIGNWDAFFFRCLDVIQIFICSAVPGKLPVGSLYSSLS